MFFIRADANQEVATGHVMRCLSIAEEMRRRNIEVTFITADHYSDALIISRGFSMICLDSIWNDMESEIPKIRKLIVEKRVKKVIIDSYYVTSRYLEEISADTDVIYIDDYGKISFPVNTIINYNIYAPQIDYITKLKNNSVKLLLGSQYTPLREEFHDIKPVFRQAVKNIFVSTGGADFYNTTRTLLDRVLDEPMFDGIIFHVISGKMNQNYNSLVKCTMGRNNVILHNNTKKISEIMQVCDIAISASGSTMYELCAMGKPIITFVLADNQILIAKSFQKEEAAIYCGDCRKGKVVEGIVAAIGKLMLDANMRKAMGEKACSLVDNRGVKRLVDKLLKGCSCE